MITPEDAIRAAAIEYEIDEIGRSLEKVIDLKYPDCKSHSASENGIEFEYEYNAAGCGCCNDMETLTLSFSWDEINGTELLTIAKKRFEEWGQMKIASEKWAEERRLEVARIDAEKRERETLANLKKKYGDGA